MGKAHCVTSICPFRIGVSDGVLEINLQGAANIGFLLRNRRRSATGELHHQQVLLQGAQKLDLAIPAVQLSLNQFVSIC
jgi:hypothetical protein